MVDAPAFKENLLAFGVCYGLCLQGLKRGQDRHQPAAARNHAISHDPGQKALGRGGGRLAVAGLRRQLISGIGRRWKACRWTAQSPNSFSVSQAARRWLSSARPASGSSNSTKPRTYFAKTDEVGQSLLQNMTNRELWLRLLKAVNLCLPRNGEAKERPKDIAKRDEIKLDCFECRWVEQLEDWYAETVKYNQKGTSSAAGEAPPRTARRSQCHGRWIPVLRLTTRCAGRAAGADRPKRSGLGIQGRPRTIITTAIRAPRA